MSPESGHTHLLTLCEPAQSKYMSTAQKSHFLPNFTGKMPRPRLGPERGHTLCASLRSQNACQDFTRATSCRNLPVKFRRPKPGRRLCASLRSRNAGQDFTKSHLIRKFAGKMLRPKTAPQTLCEPAQSKRMSRFHKSHFLRKIAGKMPRPRVRTLIKHRPLHLL